MVSGVYRGVLNMKKLFIVGTGGFGREVLWLTRRINENQCLKGKEELWDISGFLDNDMTLHGTEKDGYPVLGDCDVLQSFCEEVYVVIAIASTKVRRKVADELSGYSNVRFATLIDPSVILSDRVEIGEGCIICAGTIITVDIVIGKHVIINLDCTLGHDTILEDFVTVYPSVNISGNVNICEGVEVGTGTQIIQGKKIGRQSIIGAGAVVVKDIPEKCTAVGVPAKTIKYFE